MLQTKFNQENNCVAIATTKGFSIYTLDPIELRYQDLTEGIGCVEMLHCTSLVAVVPSGHTPGSSPRKLKLWNLQAKELICELNFSSTVLDVRLNKQRMIVCLVDQIHIFDLNSIKCIQVLSSVDNPDGLIACSTEPSCLIAFPTIGAGNASTNPGQTTAAARQGDVMVYDSISLRLVTQISAHRSTLVALEFNKDGTMIATASTTGTIIRVFSLPKGDHLYSFRRGAVSVSINTLSFDASNKYLVAGTKSTNNTIHIFSFDPSTPVQNTTTTDNTSTVSNVMNTVASSTYYALANVTLWTKSIAESIGILPEPVSEFANSTRAVATIKLPDNPSVEESISGGNASGIFNYKVAFIRSASPDPNDNMPTEGVMKIMSNEPKANKDALKIAVVTREGHLYRYLMPLINDTDINANTHTERASINNKNISIAPLCILEDEALLI